MDATVAMGNHEVPPPPREAAREHFNREDVRALASPNLGTRVAAFTRLCECDLTFRTVESRETRPRRSRRERGDGVSGAEPRGRYSELAGVIPAIARKLAADFVRGLPQRPEEYAVDALANLYNRILRSPLKCDSLTGYLGKTMWNLMVGHAFLRDALRAALNKDVTDTEKQWILEMVGRAKRGEDWDDSDELSRRLGVKATEVDRFIERVVRPVVDRRLASRPKIEVLPEEGSVEARRMYRHAFGETPDPRQVEIGGTGTETPGEVEGRRQASEHARQSLEVRLVVLLKEKGISNPAERSGTRRRAKELGAPRRSGQVEIETKGEIVGRAWVQIVFDGGYTIAKRRGRSASDPTEEKPEKGSGTRGTAGDYFPQIHHQELISELERRGTPWPCPGPNERSRVHSPGRDVRRCPVCLTALSQTVGRIRKLVRKDGESRELLRALLEANRGVRGAGAEWGLQADGGDEGGVRA